MTSSDHSFTFLHTYYTLSSQSPLLVVVVVSEYDNKGGLRERERTSKQLISN